MKRLFDIAVAVTLLIALAPVMAVTALLVRMKLGTPVLFCQLRPGYQAKPFLLYKFRTMSNKKDTHGALLPDELRLTGLGMLMRKYSLDELPQLFNVIKGDISLVGPRPLLMEYLPLYNEEQARRHAVLPGITGWAQVNGRNAVTWDERFRLDVWYVDNHSFWLDMKILFLTVKKVFAAEGISQEGRATMDKFRGNQK